MLGYANTQNRWRRACPRHRRHGRHVSEFQDEDSRRHRRYQSHVPGGRVRHTPERPLSGQRLPRSELPTRQDLGVGESSDDGHVSFCKRDHKRGKRSKPSRRATGVRSSTIPMRIDERHRVPLAACQPMPIKSSAATPRRATRPCSPAKGYAIFQNAFSVVRFFTRSSSDLAFQGRSLSISRRQASSVPSSRTGTRRSTRSEPVRLALRRPPADAATRRAPCRRSRAR